MSITKFLTFSAAGIAALTASVVMAGGPEDVAMPAPITGVYAQADIGYLDYGWNHHFPAVNFNSNRSGGLSYGGAVGYQWTRYLAAEAGVFYVPQIRGVQGLGTVKINAWFVYAAGKVMVPVKWVKGLELFAKAGIAYRENELTTTGPISEVSVTDWHPIFGAGVMYRINPSWYVKAQWLHVPSGKLLSIFGASAHIPTYNLYLFGAGYLFTM